MNELIRRSYGFSVRALKEEDRSVEVIASSDALDAYGEVLVQDWDLKRYKANPVVLYGHNAWGLPIGSASDVRVEKDQLLAKLHFVDARANPVAEQVWQGILQGSLRAVSVGFRSKSAKSQQIGDRTVFVLSGNELVEISVVPIPANPEAVAIGKKSFDLIQDLARRTALEAINGDDDMSMLLKTLLPILMLADSATDADAAGEVSRLKTFERDLFAATGKKSIPEALGVLEGWKAAAGQLAEAAAKIATLEKAGEDRDRQALIDAGVAAKKLTPALVEWAKGLPLPMLKGYLETAPANAVLARDAAKEPQHTPSTLTHNGKTWGELSFKEKHDLYHENRDLFDAMKDAAEAA